MLCLMAMVASASPVLIAVVDPAEGTAWRVDGARIESPLSKEYLHAHARRGDLQDPLAHRLFVFRWKKPKDGYVSADIPPAKGNRWPTVFRIDPPDEKGDLLVFSQEIKDDESTASFDVKYSVEPKRVMFDLQIRAGKATILEGAEYHPRLYGSRQEVESSVEPQIWNHIRRGWPPNMKSAFSFDFSPDKNWFFASLTVLQTDGTRLMVAAEKWWFGGFRLIGESVPVERLGRIVQEGMPLERLEIRGVAKNPAEGSVRPG